MKSRKGVQLWQKLAVLLIALMACFGVYTEYLQIPQTFLTAPVGQLPLLNESYDTLLDDLRQWFQKHGGMISTDIKIADIPFKTSFFSGTSYYRGLIATRDFTEGETLFILPGACIPRGPNLDFYERVSREMQESTALIWFLLVELRKAERGEKSFWRPYINTIRGVTVDSPLMWDSGRVEREKIKSSAFAQMYDRAYNNAVNQFRQIQAAQKRHPDIGGPDPHTWNEFLHAYVLSHSRAFDEAPRCHNCVALYPAVDLANHNFDPSIVRTTKPTLNLGVYVTAAHTIKKNHEIFNQYYSKDPRNALNCPYVLLAYGIKGPGC